MCVPKDGAESKLTAHRRGGQAGGTHWRGALWAAGTQRETIATAQTGRLHLNMNKMTASLMGTNDMCSFVAKEQWVASDVNAFLLQGESPIVVLRSNEGEYAFTGNGRRASRPSRARAPSLPAAVLPTC